MYDNDKYGDCVWAAIGHEIEQKTRYGSGKTVEVPVADLIAGYSAVTGFNADDPSTDNGTYVQDGLAFWRKSGIGGKHQTIMYAEVVSSNLTEVRQAVYLMGDVHVGFNFPTFAMEQFDSGKPWDLSSVNTSIEGGHAVTAVGYDANYLYVVTWGQIQKMTWAFWNKYVDEAWAIITQEWVDQNSNNAAGINLYALGQDFATLTGSANPIPAPGPTPTPTPIPTVVPAADVTLWNAVKHWAVDESHTLDNKKAAHAVQGWAASWGLS